MGMRVLLGLVFAVFLLAPWARGHEDPRSWNSAVRLGGMGGLYLLPDAGELWVEVEKQDLNRRGSPAHLRALLLGPDREVLDEQWLPDDGHDKGSGPGPVQRLRLTTEVERAGVYAVNITVTNDRYGEEVLWGFRTNSSRFLVETSRGHKDEAHTEPIVLRNEHAASDVCFLPAEGTFHIEVEDVPGAVNAVPVYAPDGSHAGDIAITNGSGAIQLTSTSHDTTPWRLHLSAAHATIHIDGVTRWDDADAFPNMSFWTPDAARWFPFHHVRWLITPYSRNVYSRDSQEGEAAFVVHNNATVPQAITLKLEPTAADWPLELSATTVRLDAKSSQPVTIRYRVPDHGASVTTHIRATPEERPTLSTFATLHLHRGPAPASEPIAVPLVLRPYQHENEQFGYTRDYPLTNEIYFDTMNRPAIASTRSWQRYRDGTWHTVESAAPSGGTPASFDLLTTKLSFDNENRVYTIGRQGKQTALLHAEDGAAIASLVPIPGSGSIDLEQFSGHNRPAGPPPFVRFTLTARDPDLFWRRLNDLHLFVPQRIDSGSIRLGDPILLSRKCIGYSGHSGKPSTIVSRDGTIHIVWAEATEPDENAPGVPTFVASYDPGAGTLSAPVLVGHGPPANDVHNTPCITIDSEGYLHVLIGTHGRTFRYARSIAPNSTSDGFTEPEELGPALRQTYIGLVCDPEDTLHAVFRLWRTDTEYFPSSHYATLAYMTKPKGGAWSAPRSLIVSPFSEYSVFYHRLTIDRAGSIYLSYDYWSTFWFYRNDHRGDRRALLTSPDRGATWSLASMGQLSKQCVGKEQ